MTKKISILVLLGFTFLLAQEGEAGYAGAIFEAGGSARSLGMAQAFMGFSDVPEVVFYNPAGLGGVNYSNLTLLGSQTYAESFHNVIEFTMPWGTFGTFGITFAGLFASLGEVRDADNVVIETSANVMMSGFMLSYGKKFGLFATGLSPKLIFNNIYNTQGMGFDMDLGFLFYPLKLLPKLPYDLFVVGLSVKNLLGSKIKMETEEDVLPRIIRTGIALHLMDGRFSVSSDVAMYSWEGSSSMKYFAGFELYPVRTFAIRGGVNKDYFTAGAGIDIDMTRTLGVCVDYAIGMHHSSQFMVPVVHKLSLNFRLKNIAGIWVEVTPSVLRSPTEYAQIIIHGGAQFKGKIKRWEFLIKDEGGNVRYRQRRDVYSERDELPPKITWNGVDNIRGGSVDSGKYYYEIRLIDKMGDVMKYTGYLVTVKWQR